MVRVSYETIKETFEKEGCKLLTTKYEMINLLKEIQLYIIVT